MNVPEVIIVFIDVCLVTRFECVASYFAVFGQIAFGDIDATFDNFPAISTPPAVVEDPTHIVSTKVWFDGSSQRDVAMGRMWKAGKVGDIHGLCPLDYVHAHGFMVM